MLGQFCSPAIFRDWASSKTNSHYYWPLLLQRLINNFLCSECALSLSGLPCIVFLLVWPWRRSCNPLPSRLLAECCSFFSSPCFCFLFRSTMLFQPCMLSSRWWPNPCPFIVRCRIILSDISAHFLLLSFPKIKHVAQAVCENFGCILWLHFEWKVKTYWWILSEKTWQNIANTRNLGGGE